MIFELAGQVGVDPDPRTLRELTQMATGRGKLVWAVVSKILAAVWSANSNLKRIRIFEPHEFSPYAPPSSGRKGVRITADNIHLLSAALVGKPATTGGKD